MRVTTASTRPSPSKSAKAAPRCIAGAPTSCGVNVPSPRAISSRFGCRGFAAGELFRVVVDIAAGHEKIFVSVVVEVVRAQTPAAQREGGRSDRDDRWHRQRVPCRDFERAGKSRSSGRRRRDPDGHHYPGRESPLPSTRARGHRRSSPSGAQSGFAKRAVALVVEQEVRNGVVGDEKSVRPSPS